MAKYPNNQILTVLIILNCLLITSNCFSQGAAINATGAAANVSAGLDVNFNDRGLLIPRLTIAQRDSIDNPAEGLQIINTDCKTLEIYFNNSWLPLNLSSNVPVNVTAGNNTTNKTEIVWTWQSAPGATGYKYNTINDYNTAIDNGINTIYSQNGLNCETIYNLYVWAYNNCGRSDVYVLADTTLPFFICGIDILSDTRDSKSYQTVKIGNQCWMKDNLNYDDNLGNSWCYQNNPNNCFTYGRLYTWDAASGGSSSSSNPSGVQGICPTGWHLPSDAEWTQLTNFLSSNSQYWCSSNSAQIAKSLASTTNWNTSTNTCAVGNSLNNNNSSGFTATPGGYRTTNGVFDLLDDHICWWSATDYGTEAWRLYLLYNESIVLRNPYTKGSGFSVRCLLD